jgi:phosphoribosylaminoimidazole (AIR) synthetase
VLNRRAAKACLLIRKLIPKLEENFGGMPVGMALLEPARLYVKPVLGLMEQVFGAGPISPAATF